MPPTRSAVLLIQSRCRYDWLLRLDGRDVVLGSEGIACEPSSRLSFAVLDGKRAFTIVNRTERWARDRGGTRSAATTLGLLDEDGSPLLDPPCLAFAYPVDDGAVLLLLDRCVCVLAANHRPSGS